MVSKLAYVLGILAALGFGWGSLRPVLKAASEVHGLARPAWDTPAHPLNRLREYTEGYADLVMWGNEAEYNFLLDKDSPTRFVYQYALMNPAFATDQMVEEFVSGLEASMPLIVDASRGNADAIPLEPGRRAELLAEPGASDKYRYLQPLFSFIDANYQPGGNLARNWIVLVPNP